MALVEHSNYGAWIGRLSAAVYHFWNNLSDDQQEEIINRANHNFNHIVATLNEHYQEGVNAIYHALHDTDQSIIDEYTDDYASAFETNDPYEDLEQATQEAAKRRRTMPGNIPAQQGTEDEDQAAPGIEGALEPIHHVWRRFPNVETASLKWIYTQLMGANANNNATYRPSGSAWDQQNKRDIVTPNTYAAAQTTLDGSPTGAILGTPMLIQYRMTSPYNILSNTDSGNLSEPQWIGFFDSKYQYYHVAKTKWALAFTLGFNDVSGGNGVPLGEDHQQYYAFYVYWKYTSEDNPPVSETVDTTGKTAYTGTTLPLTSDDYDRMGGWNKVWIHGDNRRLTRKVITGQYETGQCRMDVKMINDPKHSGTATAEGWTAVKATALFPENLSVILVQDPAFDCSPLSSVNIAIRSEIDYLVQFRDLQSKYKFPIQSAAIGGTFDDGQYFYRGAAQLHPSTVAATATEGTYN